MHFKQWHLYGLILFLCFCIAKSLSATEKTSTQLQTGNQTTPASTANSVNTPSIPVPPVVYDTPPPPPPYHPEIKIPSQELWQKIEIVTATEHELGNFYKELFTKHLLAGIDQGDPAYFGETTKYEDARKLAIDTASRGFNSNYYLFEGEEGGWWHFYGVNGNLAPRNLVKLTFPSKNNYIAKFQVYCIQKDQDCNKLIEEVKIIPAPYPESKVVDQRYLEWRLIRTDGPCFTTMPLAKPAPIYPSDALFEKISGEVKVLYSADACGLPLSVTIYKSSRSRSLDRAAINAVWNWRIDISDLNKDHIRGQFRSVIVPISFFGY